MRPLGAAGLALGFGFQIHALPLLGHPISSPLLSIPLTLLWILLVTNAFNLIDGLDGLSGGLAFIAGLTLLALSLVRGGVQTALLATALCGAIGGFLKHSCQLNPPGARASRPQRAAKMAALPGSNLNCHDQESIGHPRG